MTAVTRAQENAGGDRNGAGLPKVPSIPLSEERTAAAAGDGASIGGLVKEATTQLSTLVRAELELAKQEVASEVKKGLIGSVFFIVALVVALYSSFFFFFTLAELIAVWLPRWAAFLIVFVAMFATAVLFVVLGIRKVKRIRAPKRTIATVKDTAAALSHRGDDAADAS